MGDKIVDKYSGYFIKLIGYDENEGYTKEGFKILSKSVMESDDEDEKIEDNIKSSNNIIKGSTYVLKQIQNKREFVNLMYP